MPTVVVRRTTVLEWNVGLECWIGMLDCHGMIWKTDQVSWLNPVVLPVGLHSKLGKEGGDEDVIKVPLTCRAKLNCSGFADEVALLAPLV